MNKCMLEMTYKSLYNVKDPPEGRDRKNIVEKNRKRTIIALKVELSLRNSDLIINLSPWTYISSIVTYSFMLSYTLNLS